jgi:acetyltransferase-like isoleucine patch superfamily enzyme
VTLGSDIWIGMGVCILPGVTLGDGCVVGAGAVVTRDVEPYVIVVGNPATPIRSRVAS